MRLGENQIVAGGWQQFGLQIGNQPAGAINGSDRIVKYFLTADEQQRRRGEMAQLRIGHFGDDGSEQPFEISFANGGLIDHGVEQGMISRIVDLPVDRSPFEEVVGKIMIRPQGYRDRL